MVIETSLLSDKLICSSDGLQVLTLCRITSLFRSFGETCCLLIQGIQKYILIKKFHHQNYSSIHLNQNLFTTENGGSCFYRNVGTNIHMPRGVRAAPTVKTCKIVTQFRTEHCLCNLVAETRIIFTWK